jgi:hypothetical protein
MSEFLKYQAAVGLELAFARISGKTFHVTAWVVVGLLRVY